MCWDVLGSAQPGDPTSQDEGEHLGTAGNSPGMAKPLRFSMSPLISAGEVLRDSSLSPTALIPSQMLTPAFYSFAPSSTATGFPDFQG